MTTTLQKYPFPTPSTGVMRNVHPRELSLNGLTYAKNWIRRNGVFHTRDGLAMFSPQMDSVSTATEVVLGMYQYDYQKDGVYEYSSDPSKDSLVVVTDDALYHKVPAPTSGAWSIATEATDDFLTPVIGPNATTGKLWDYTDKIEVYLETASWIEIAEALGVTVASLEWITLELIIETPVAGSCNWKAKIYDGDAPANTWEHLTFRGCSPGVPAQLADVGAGDNFGVWVLFNDENFDNEMVQFGVGPPYYIYYRCRIWQGAEQTAFGLSGDRDNLEVMRAWDFGQETHVLVASPNHPVADFTMGDNTIAVAGGGVTTPKAKTISLVGQRVVAGNVSFLDAVAVIEDNDTDENVLTYAHYPDGIVYSGTVLEDGHNKWYQEYLIRLADTPGSIMASLEMGTMMLAVYKTDAIVVLAVQTGTEPFRPDWRAQGIQGPVGPRAVAAISDNLHVFLGRDGALYLFDGSPPRSLGAGVQEWLAKDMDVDYAHRSHLAWDPEMRELRVWYPAKGHNGRVRCGLVIGFDEQNQPAWPIEHYAESSKAGMAPPTFTADWDITCSLPAYVDAIAIPGEMLSFSGNSVEPLGTLTTRQRRMLVCNCVGAGSIYKPDILYESPTVGDTYSNGTAYPIRTSFRSGTTDFEMPDRMKVVTEIELLLDTGNATGFPARDEMTVKLWSGGQNTVLQESYQVDVDTTTGDPYFAEFREEGRFFAMEFAIQTLVRRNFGGAFAAFKQRGRPR